MRQLARQVVLLGAVCSLFVSAALAQVTSATLNGSVSDSTGGTIPGAQIQIQNINTGVSEAVLTNDAGEYSATLLPPGQYTLTVQKEGYKKRVETGIVLTVSQVATLNVILQVGAVDESVTVTANEELMDVTNADISNEVNEAAVKELPLNGRDPSTLVFLSPGTTNITYTYYTSYWLQNTNIFPTETGASSGGGRQGSTYYTLDGMSNMDPYSGLAQPAPNADATQEFRVLTSNFDAQYGYSPGAVVTLQTKSGTNTFHGGLFEFIRNNDLNAADYFSKTVNMLKRNQFGGYVGGPVFKNKLFFFANYQGTRTNSTVSNGNMFTPTAAMLKGDFSAVSQTLPAPFQTVNGVPNQIDPNLFDPIMVKIVNLGMPRGQDPQTGNVYYSDPPQAVSYNEDTDRLDYTINDKQRLFVRSFIQTYSQPAGDVPGNLLAVVNGQTGHDFNEVLGHNWTINGSTVNSLTFGFGQMDTLAGAQAKTSDGNTFCWSKYIAVTEPGPCSLEGFTWDQGFGPYTEPISQRRTTWELSDSLIKTMGNLTLSAGVDVHKLFSGETTEWPSAPIVTFWNFYTGNGLADLLLGDLDAFQQGGGEVIPIKNWQPGAYVQAQYRFRPNLTVTAGLRWDPYLAPVSVGGRDVVFEPGARSTMYPNAPAGLVFPGDQGIPSGLTSSTLDLYEPRVGVAWVPSRLTHTAIRAGFGVFTGPLAYNLFNHVADIAPFSPTFSLSGNVANPIKVDNPWAAGPATGSPGFNPFASGNFASASYKPPTNSTFVLPVSVGQSFAPGFQPYTTTDWSVSIEQQLASDLALHVAYVGSHTDHANLMLDRNPGNTNPADTTFATRTLYPNYSTIYQNQSIGTASYNALEIGVDRRMSHGLQVQSNFTWSKSLDYQSITSGSVSNPIDLRWNYGISGLNVPLMWVSNFTYTSPSLGSWNLLARSILGSWELSSIYTIQSGMNFSINGDGGPPSTQSGALQGGERANIVQGVSPNVHSGSKQHWLRQYLNPAAFSNNANGTFGDSGKNIYHTVHINTADAAISKNWRIAERYGVQLRMDMFNAFNHPSFGPPDTNIGDGGGYVNGVWTPNPNGPFGEITWTGPVPAREMQGALKFTF